MAALTSFCTLSRFVNKIQSQFWALAARKRMAWLSRSAPRCYTSGNSSSPLENFFSGLERYKDLQRYFKRRLRATYGRFSDVPYNSVVCGYHHVYFVEADGIYRMDSRQNDPKPEKVLDLGQCSVREETEIKRENGEQNVEWTIQRVRLSPQEKHLAATLKTCDSEEHRCVVLRLRERPSLPLEPPQIILTLDKVFSFEWATEEVLLYTTLEGLRCNSVLRLDLTPTGARITPVLQETQPDVFVEVALSTDRRLLTINCNSKSSSEVWSIDVNTPSLEPILVQPRQPQLLYHVEHWRCWLIILANTGPGQEYQVLRAPLSRPSMVSWEPLYAPDPGISVKDMEVVGNHCVLVVREPTGELALTVVPLTHPQESYTIQLPSWVCTIEMKRPGLADQHSDLEFLVSSPVCPPVSYCLHLKDGLILLGTEEDGTSRENQGNYTTTRLEARSQDGTLVPVTVLHAQSVECLKEAPLLVHVYGAYGRDLNMEFCPERRLLMELGWALAYCHIRGGGERGLSWHRQACVEGKQRGVEDLRACLQHLFSSGISSPLLTALASCSAGAVPVGALCNTNPHLMRAVILQAPFLDVLGTMQDPRLPLTVEEREEWGDPLADQQHRLTIASYCPLHNITPQRYPSMLLTAYSGDARVPLAGVIKYTERLKKAIHTHFTIHPVSDYETAPNVVLNIQHGANHLGPEDFELMLEESALQLAFLYTELGLEPPRRPRKRRT